jgi:hypothetical protein
MAVNNATNSQVTQYNTITCGANNALNNVSPGTSGWVLTSNGAAAQPTFQANAGGGIGTINGDSGSITGSTVTINGGTTGLTTSGSSATMNLTGTLVVANGGTGAATFTAYSVLCAGTTSTGAFQNVSGLGTTGYVLTSNGAGALPTWQAASGGGLAWSVITADQSITVANGYICNKAGLLTLTLPASANIGDTFEVTGINTDLGWKIAQNANQQIFFSGQSTTVGAGGSLASSLKRDSLRAICVVSGASTVWNIVSSVGNITVV